ncbi:hypothetical protein EON67_10705 [archaeon]|nr:MAG: hypothetical protein EON67_10705 [archaeon]
MSATAGSAGVPPAGADAIENVRSCVLQLPAVHFPVLALRTHAPLRDTVHAHVFLSYCCCMIACV